MSTQIKMNFHLHFKYLHNVWPIAIRVWILFCMPFSRQHTVLHFGRLFLVEKSRLTSVEPRLMEMLLMGIGNSWFQIYKKLLFFGSLLNACLNLSFFILIRYHSRFFVQVGHETTYANSGNKHFFAKSCHCQTFQNY